GSIPFFIALYQSFRLLGYIEQNKVFSQGAVDALKTIKYCGIAIAILIVVGQSILVVTQHGKDDMAGFLALGIIVTFISIAVATAAAVFQKLLQKAVDI